MRLDEIRQISLDQSGQYIAPFSIDAAHGPDMRAEMSTFHKPGKRQLRHRCGMPIKQGARNGHRFDQLRRQYHVADTQARKE